jgi:hypothetical protein
MRRAFRGGRPSVGVSATSSTSDTFGLFWVFSGERDSRRSDGSCGVVFLTAPTGGRAGSDFDVIKTGGFGVDWPNRLAAEISYPFTALWTGRTELDESYSSESDESAREYRASKYAAFAMVLANVDLWGLLCVRRSQNVTSKFYAATWWIEDTDCQIIRSLS